MLTVAANRLEEAWGEAKPAIRQITKETLNALEEEMEAILDRHDSPVVRSLQRSSGQAQLAMVEFHHALETCLSECEATLNSESSRREIKNSMNSFDWWIWERESAKRSAVETAHRIAARTTSDRFEELRVSLLNSIDEAGRLVSGTWVDELNMEVDRREREMKARLEADEATLGTKRAQVRERVKVAEHQVRQSKQTASAMRDALEQAGAFVSRFESGTQT